MTFKSLTKSNTIPNIGRLAPLKLIHRALDGDFGPLPQDVVGRSDDDSDYVENSMVGLDDDSSDREVCTQLGPVTRLRRNKRVKI